MGDGIATEIVIPYMPRPLQKVLHANWEAHRFNVAVCHRRFGKTVMAVNHLIKGALTCTKERPRFAYIAPSFRQGKDVAWEYMKKYAHAVQGCNINESELRVDFPGGRRVRIYGADYPDSLRGLYFDGVVLDEYGMMRPQTWSEVVLPTLNERQGWAVFIGTPNGKNQFYERVKDAQNKAGWSFAEYKASKTDVLNADELAIQRSNMSPDEYAQEYECSFDASVKGAVFSGELLLMREEDRITHVPYMHELVVDTCWDIGYRDATAIWFIQSPVGGAIRVIDYHEDSGQSLEHYASVLQTKGYRYGSHVFPHDIAHHEWTTGKSRIERASELLQPIGVVKQEMVSFDDSLHEARLALKKAWFDTEKTARGIDALSSYRWLFNTQSHAYTRTPVHDWASHCADAWRTVAMWHISPMRVKPKKALRDEGEMDHERMLRREYGYRKPQRPGLGRGGY
jgi:phage terminase large subunit